MADLGPEERELFESLATPLYEEAALNGGLKEDDPRIAADGELHAALQLLVSLNLLVHDHPNAIYVPVDPTTVQSHVVGPMSQRGVELLGESSDWARAFGGLSQAWRRSPTAVRGPITRVPRPRHPDVHQRGRRRGRGGAAHRPAADRPRAGEPEGGRGPRQGRDRARRPDAHALPAQRPPARADPRVRRRGELRRSRGAHPGRVLQPDDRRRPAARGDPRSRPATTSPSPSRSPRWSPTSSTSSSVPGSAPARSPTPSAR